MYLPLRQIMGIYLIISQFLGAKAFTAPFIRKIWKIARTGIVISGINNIIDFSHDIEVIDHKVRGSLKNTDDILLPNKIVVENSKCGAEWAYSQLIHYIENNHVLSVSISENAKYVIALDDINKVPNYSDLHYVAIIPIHVTDLINMLVQHNIDFNVINLK